MWCRAYNFARLIIYSTPTHPAGVARGDSEISPHTYSQIKRSKPWAEASIPVKFKTEPGLHHLPNINPATCSIPRFTDITLRSTETRRTSLFTIYIINWLCHSMSSLFEWSKCWGHTGFLWESGVYFNKLEFYLSLSIYLYLPVHHQSLVDVFATLNLRYRIFFLFKLLRRYFLCLTSYTYYTYSFEYGFWVMGRKKLGLLVASRTLSLVSVTVHGLCGILPYVICAE